MKVKELKELLKDLPDDMEVLTSSDGEGNSFSKLDDISKLFVGKEDLKDGSTDTLYSEEEIEEEDYIKEDFQECLVLWPE